MFSVFSLLSFPLYDLPCFMIRLQQNQSLFLANWLSIKFSPVKYLKNVESLIMDSICQINSPRGSLNLTLIQYQIPMFTSLKIISSTVFQGPSPPVSLNLRSTRVAALSLCVVEKGVKCASEM